MLIIIKDVCRPLEVAEVRVGVIVKRAERKNFHVKIRGFYCSCVSSQLWSGFVTNMQS